MPEIVDRTTWRLHGDNMRTNGRPSAQWERLAAGRDDDLGTSSPHSDGSHSCH